jgi:hypothetical protein
MKRRLGLLVVFGFGLLVIGCAGMGQDVKKQAMSFVVTTPVVELSQGARVVMYGTGFEPKREVTLLFMDAAGAASGISGTVKPEPVPNKDGAWAAVWNCDDYLKMIAPGTGMISVVDQEYKTLVQAPVLFLAAPKKPEPKKDEPKKK